MYSQKFSANFGDRIPQKKFSFGSSMQIVHTNVFVRDKTIVFALFRLMSVSFLSRAIWIALTLMIPLALVMSITEIGRQTSPNVYAQTTDEAEILAIYALAFDSAPNSISNLASYYTPTIAAITEAVTNTPGKVAVVLADLNDYKDTHVLIIRNGVEIENLPVDELGLDLESLENEWDMANGEYLGNFILWARDNYTSPKTIFSFVGHGAPLVPPPYIPLLPDTVLDEQLSENNETSSSDPVFLQPLPPRWAAHSNFTDHYSGSLLSINALARALDIGTASGANPLTVLDLIHCFSASIEELYALSPYTEMIAGAPNYTYSKPDMLGLALDDLELEWDAVQMANSLVETYHNTLPDEGHPRLLLSVDTEKIEPIKEAWDETAFHLNSAFDADKDEARKHILAAYDQSAKYDTTLCTQEQEWQLGPPDALSDMADFAQKLGEQFDADSDVRLWADETNQRIQDAIQSRQVVTGTPWFAEPVTTTLSVADINTPTGSLTNTLPIWTFAGQGISLFTDFGPILGDDGQPRFSWQAAWYTETATITRTDVETITITPYTFLEESQTGVNWADIFHRYWADVQPISLPDTNIDCAPSFLSSRGSSDLAVKPLSNSRFVLHSQPITFTAVISSAGEATNPIVSFHVLRNNEEVFSSHSIAGYMEANSQQTIHSSISWTPLDIGEYELVIAVDVDDRFAETDETDNTRRQTLLVFDEISTLYLPAIMH